MSRSEYLFDGNDWLDVDRAQRQALASEVAQIDTNRLLNTSVDDLVAYLVNKFHIAVPALDVESLVVEQAEEQIDVSRDPLRSIRDRSRPFYIRGMRIDIEIPFTGDASAFQIRPNPHTLSPPYAAVRDSVVTFTVRGVNLGAAQVRSQIDRLISDVQSYLNTLRSNAAGFNEQLPAAARASVDARRSTLLANQSVVASLGFKLKTRPDTPRTFAPAEVRRKIAPVLPPASSMPYKAEPALAPADYEHILGVVESMAKVMELSPTVFHAVDEEALRSHFLVQLNGHYQGEATGETFNYGGKTDILVRSDGRNVFIAECKYWSGAKSVGDTIDQLLGYSSWRDTKTAVIMFNRNLDFSNVLKAIPSAVREHPNFKRELPGSTETTFRYLFSHKDDRNRELLLTVLAFNIPTPRG